MFRPIRLGVLAALATCVLTARAEAPATFSFDGVVSTADMQHLIEARFPPGTAQEALRQTFVTEGKATRKIHPTRAGIEKYIYDINLCDHYIWRWNVSADYNTSGQLLQAYVNGDPVFPGGPQKRDIKSLSGGGNASIIKGARPRPEATKGEMSLAYILFDGDANPATTDDQVLMGGGPTRADPYNMGKLYVYTGVDPWRSIFDADAADQIHPYRGDCRDVGQFYARPAPLTAPASAPVR